MPPALYRCWIKENQVHAVIDYSAASGVLALECLKKGVEYTGVCFTDVHMRELIDHLTECVFREMLDSESLLRDSALATLLQPKKKAEKPKKKTEKSESLTPSEKHTKAEKSDSVTPSKLKKT